MESARPYVQRFPTLNGDDTCCEEGRSSRPLRYVNNGDPSRSPCDGSYECGDGPLCRLGGQRGRGARRGGRRLRAAGGAGGGGAGGAGGGGGAGSRLRSGRLGFALQPLSLRLAEILQEICRIMNIIE